MVTLSLKNKIYAYLGYRGVKEGAAVDAAVAECLEELEKLAHFCYIFKRFEALPEFLNKQPYLNYFSGSRGVIVAVMTLGGEVDRRIKLYGRTDAAKAVIFDACASALLEELSDGYEKSLEEDLSYRFCPGYGGSDISDVKYIFEILRPEKIGVTLTETGYMLPSKTMAGVIAVGGGAKKSCKNCIAAQGCAYLKGGNTCYGSEKK